MTEWTAYNDAHSRTVFRMFEARLRPLMAQMAPDWLLHHIEMRRELTQDYVEQVEIRLIIRPIGSAHFGAPDADLQTGPLRLQQKKPPGVAGG